VPTLFYCKNFQFILVVYADMRSVLDKISVFFFFFSSIARLNLKFLANMVECLSTTIRILREEIFQIKLVRGIMRYCTNSMHEGY